MSYDELDTTRRRVLLGMGTAMTVGLAGCGGGGDDGTDTATASETDGGMDGTDMSTDTATATPAPTGNARVAHMSPDAPNVDVYVDGDAVLEDVAFGAVSDYLAVPAGEREVEITAAGDAETSVFSGPVTVEADTNYTVVAAGEISEGADEAFEPLVLTDAFPDVGDSEAGIRVVHASPDAPAVDVTTGGGSVVLADGAAFRDATEYATAEANDYTVSVRGDTESNDGDVVADFDVSLNGGTVYTAFAAGYLSPDDDPADTAFDLFPVQDSSSDGM